MQKTEVIARVAKESGMTQADTAKVVNTLLSVITEALKDGEKVTLTGFGAFEVREAAPRAGINIRTMQRIELPSSKRPSFSAGSLLKAAVNPKK
ncbi:MAG: HU family DNA-binding protein [Anaerolineae bacterium]|nr:HU family DNA-binding protein [Anaerolineae bacterium]